MLNRKKSQCFMFIAMFLLLLSGLPQVAAQTSGTINTATRYQTMEGFGAAIAWYNIWVTEHPNKLEIYNLLFRDISLDILRIRNTYRYTLPFDSGNEEIVRFAELSLGHPIIVYISSWSPPADIKSNGNTEGQGGTLLKQNGSFVYDLFADYWYDSLVAYADVGIIPKYISIQNEPDYTAQWESCVFKEQESSSYPGYGIALDAVYNRIQSLPNPPGLLGGETTGIINNLVEKYAAGMNLNQVYGIAHHLYNGGDPNNPDSFNSALRGVASAFPDIPVFQTEFDGGSAFNTAQLIHNCIVEGNAVAYIFWELVWENTNGKCMVILDNPQTADSWSTPGGYTLTDYYYYIKQFSKFIDPGFTRVAASVNSSNVKITAYVSPTEDQLTAVLINEGSATENVSLNVSGFTIGSSEVYRTGGNDKFAFQGSLGTGHSLSLPARSVATILMNSPGFQPTAVPPPLPTPEPPPESRSAFDRIEAETYNDQSGILTELCGDTGGGRAVAYIENGDYVIYNNVDFADGATVFQARASGNGSGGTIEVRLGGLNGVLAGSVDIPITGDWQIYNTFSTALTATIGVNDLYLVFTGVEGYLMNLNWFTFTAGEVPPTPIPTPSPTPSPTPTPGNESGGLRVRYMCSDTATSTNQLKPHLDIINGQPETIALSDLKLRYYYTKEGSATQEFHVDYAMIDSGNVTGLFYSDYAEIGFKAAAGSLPGGTTSGQIQIRINKSDWSGYDQSNDYSFAPGYTSFRDYERITIYLDGVLVWGQEPGGPTPGTPTPSPTPSPTPVNGSNLGDVNNDDMINIIDALMTAQYYVGLDPVGFIPGNADTNCDGSITIVDALMIAQYYVGQISKFC